MTEDVEHVDDDGHVGDSEMSVGVLPETELESSVLSMVSGRCSDTVPVEHELVGSC